MNWRHLLAFGLLILVAPAAQAHKPSDSYLSLTAQGEHLEGIWRIAIRDLDLLVPLDLNGDRQVNWGELQTATPRIQVEVLGHISLVSGGETCTEHTGSLAVEQLSDGGYVVVPLGFTCTGLQADPVLHYSLLFDQDATHRGLLSLTADGRVTTGIFSPTTRTQVLALQGGSLWYTFVDFIREGVWHIWIGFDHILFLIALLLPAVFARAGGHWQPQAGFAPVLADVTRIVTLFTIAHSMSLSAAVLGWVSLPGALVESVIAASVVIAAVNVVYPLLHRRRWLLAGGFGFIHGFGFAGVLTDLGLPQNAKALALLAFNLGVEAGQLAIVLAALPVMYLLRGQSAYRRFAVPGAAWSIAVLGTLWAVERSFGVGG